MKTSKGSSFLTSVILALDVRLFAVTLFEFPVAFGLMGPDHEARVAPANRHQEAVVVGPPHIGDMRAVGHVALELCIFSLEVKTTFYLL